MNNPEAIPEFARLALVPVANPETAEDLLRLATALVYPEDGRIIALTVALGDVEQAAKTLEQVQPIVEMLVEEGYNIELESTESTSVARGILDTARESGSDLIILGIYQRQRGQVTLGTVVESVLDTAPCDVLIYRSGDNGDFSRIVLPIDPNFQSQAAARVGIRLAQRRQTKIEAMYVQPSGRSYYEGLAHIEATFAGVPGQNRVKRTVVTAQDPTDAVLVRTYEEDLIIVGFTERSEFERWMFGDLAKEILNQAEGPVIMVSRSLTNGKASERLGRRLLNWLRPTLTRVEQQEIVRKANEMCAPDLDYIVLILVSAALASLGLLLNSAAVVIGAMLVAPFMSPLTGVAVGLSVGRVWMARRALSSLLIGVLLAVLVAVFLGVILPINIPTDEMLARGEPTLLDAAVALAAGVVGAYATARKDIPAALAGVAIAAALMPPVCTIGLGIAFQEADLAYGAAILFFTNIVCIIAAGMIVYLWLGMMVREQEGVSRLAQVVAISLFLLAALPVVLQLATITQTAMLDNQIREEFQAAIQPADLVSMEFNHDEDTLRVIALIRSPRALTQAEIRQVQSELTNRLGEPVRLEVIVQEVILFEVDPD